MDKGRDGWLNIRDAAAYSGFSIRRLRELASEGRIQSVRPAGRYRFRREWLDAYMFGSALPEERKTRKDRRVKQRNGKTFYAF